MVGITRYVLFVFYTYIQIAYGVALNVKVHLLGKINHLSANTEIKNLLFPNS